MIFTKTIIEAMKHWVNGRLTNYVEIIKGKGLSTEDYTPEEKEKLSTVQAGAEKNVQSDWTEADETQDSFILNKPVEVTPKDVLEYMTSEEIIDPVASNINNLYTNNDGKIYTL